MTNTCPVGQDLKIGILRGWGGGVPLKMKHLSRYVCLCLTICVRGNHPPSQIASASYDLCTPPFAGHPLLQLRVVTCFFILVGARVVNVFVPIYYRNIVNALTPSSIPGGNHTHQLNAALGPTHDTTGVTFPLSSILLYVFLRFLQVGAI